MAVRRSRVVIVDDHPLMRDGIAALLSASEDFELVGEASGGAQAVTACGELRPDIVLMDLQMSDGNGLEAVATIRRACPSIRVVVLTTSAADGLATRALRAGVQAYLLKSTVRRELIDVLRDVCRGLVRVSPEVAGLVVSRIGEEELSPREQEVLQNIALGNSNKTIAAALSVAEETVKGHVKNILSKLGARDRTHAAMIGVTRGLIDMPSPD